jgi:hypothetical protein
VHAAILTETSDFTFRKYAQTPSAARTRSDEHSKKQRCGAGGSRHAHAAKAPRRRESWCMWKTSRWGNNETISRSGMELIATGFFQPTDPLWPTGPKPLVLIAVLIAEGKINTGLQEIGGLWNLGALIDRSLRSWPSTGLQLYLLVSIQHSVSLISIFLYSVSLWLRINHYFHQEVFFNFEMKKF